MVEDTQAILCPGCGKVMARHREGDLVRDECGTCRGVFLDRGELNALVTAISGDMEWNTATGEQAVDTAPERMCPRCLEGPMQKRPFLSYLGVVLDVCPACGGVYLDAGELDAVNGCLKRLEKHHGRADFRGEIAGRFTRVEWWPALRTVFEWVGISIPRGEDWGLIVQLFLKKSLGCGLHIARQTRLEQLLRALGLSKSVHIRTGYPEIDGLCSIQSTDPKKVLRILAVPEIRMALVELIGTEPALFLAPGTVTVLDDRILYVESPGNPAVHDLRAALEQDERGVFGRLNRLACFIEEAVDKE